MTSPRDFDWGRPLAIAALASITSTAAFGQNLSEKTALEGVKAVDAHVELTWDERIPAAVGLTEQLARTRMDERFAFALRTLGIEVTPSSTGGLFCDVILLRPPEAPIVFYSVTVYHTTYVMLPRLSGRILIAPIWRDRWAGRVGQTNLSNALEGIARSCAERFGKIWLAANPRS